MRILTEGLPTKIMVGQEVCRIRYDYKTCLKIIMAFEDRELTGAEKAAVLLDLLYIDRPNDLQAALEKGVRFLDCGEKREDGKVGGEERRIYSFWYDEKYIFAGVNKVLNGRLSLGTPVHWWEFVLAFLDLPEDCMMSRIIYYRSRYAKGKLTKEEREVWAKNKEIFELPVKMTDQEEDALAEFMKRLKE